MGRGRRGRRRPTIWRIPDELWCAVESDAADARVPAVRRAAAAESTQIVDGVVFVLRTGCQWKAVPSTYGSGSTLHRRFQHWVDTGVWEAMWRL